MSDPLGNYPLSQPCPLCDDNNWSVMKDLYLPKATISLSAPGFGLHVRTYVCGTCGYVLLMKLPEPQQPEGL